MLDLNKIKKEDGYVEVWGFERVRNKRLAQLDLSKIGALFNGQYFSIRFYHADGLLIDYMGSEQVIIPVTYEYDEDDYYSDEKCTNPWKNHILNYNMMTVHEYYNLDDTGFYYDPRILKANSKLIIIQNTINDFFHTEREARASLRYIQGTLMKGIEDDLFR